MPPAISLLLAVMLVLVVMTNGIGPGAPACVLCGKRFRHADDCPKSR